MPSLQSTPLVALWCCCWAMASYAEHQAQAAACPVADPARQAIDKSLSTPLPHTSMAQSCASYGDLTIRNFPVFNTETLTQWLAEATSGPRQGPLHRPFTRCAKGGMHNNEAPKINVECAGMMKTNSIHAKGLASPHTNRILGSMLKWRSKGEGGGEPSKASKGPQRLRRAKTKGFEGLRREGFEGSKPRRRGFMPSEGFKGFEGCGQ